MPARTTTAAAQATRRAAGSGHTPRARTCAIPSASTTASTGSILYTLRNADSGPSSSAWTCWCSGPPSGPA